jgi:hypothetical protein
VQLDKETVLSHLLGKAIMNSYILLSLCSGKEISQNFDLLTYAGQQTHVKRQASRHQYNRKTGLYRQKALAHSIRLAVIPGMFNSQGKKKSQCKVPEI